MKIGVRLEPPSIVCIYKESNKLRMRVMPLRNVWPKTDTNFVFDDLRTRHGKYLESIPRETVIKMINIIKEHKKGLDLEDILKKYDSSKTHLKYLDDERQIGTKFIESKKKELMKDLTKTISDEEDEMSENRSSENRNRKVKTKFTMKKKSNVTFGKNDSNSDSDESDFKINKAEINFESDEDFEIDKDMKDKDKQLNKIASQKSTLRKSELTDVSNFPKLRIRDSSKNFTKEIANDILKTDVNMKNKFKDLLDMHEKIDSPADSKLSKSEDDTDVEFDGSDIPLEEDFY